MTFYSKLFWRHKYDMATISIISIDPTPPIKNFSSYIDSSHYIGFSSVSANSVY